MLRELHAPPHFSTSASLSPLAASLQGGFVFFLHLSHLTSGESCTLGADAWLCGLPALISLHQRAHLPPSARRADAVLLK